MAKESFAIKLGRARRSRGLTQAEVGDWVGSVKGTVSRWENGANRPSRDVVEILDRRLGFQGELLRQWQVEQTGSELPHWKQHVPWLKANSHTIEAVSLDFVYGFLQSPSYVRFIFKEMYYGWSDQAVENQVSIRREQHEWMSSACAPRVICVMSVTALTGLPRSVRSEQAGHLIQLIEQAHLSIHLVSENIPIYIPSIMVIYHLRQGGVSVTSETNNGILIHQDEESTTRHVRSFNHVLGSSSSKSESNSILEGLIA